MGHSIIAQVTDSVRKEVKEWRVAGDVDCDQTLGVVSLRRVSPVRFIPPALQAPPWLLGGRRCQSLPSTSSLNRLLAHREHGSTQVPWRGAQRNPLGVYCVRGPRAAWIASQSLGAVYGISIWSIPRGASASMTALATAGGRAVASGLADPFDPERMERIRRHRLAQG